MLAKTYLQRFFTLLLITVLMTPFAFAGKGGGKGGGGGGGEDPPAADPPYTYIISWIDDFQAKQVNTDGDLFGDSGDINGNDYGSFVVYNGSGFSIEDFFVGTGATLRNTECISDRAFDGSLYLGGTAFSGTGEVRGFLLKLSPDGNGDLQLSSFDLILPFAGDDASRVSSVNSIGEAGIVSTILSNQSVLNAGFYSPTDGAYEIGPGSTQMKVTELGEWYGLLGNGDGTFSHFRWTIVNGTEHRLDDFTSADTNNFGSMVGTRTSSTRKGTLTTNYFFDGSLTELSSRQGLEGPTVMALNDIDDYVADSVTGIGGKPSSPPSYTTAIFLTGTNAEFQIADMLDASNQQADVDLFNSIPKHTVGLSNSGIIVGTDTSWTTYVLIPVQP